MRSWWIGVVLGLFLLLAGAGSVTAGVEFDAALGQTGQGRCHMDNCEFFIMQAAIPVAELKDGTLFAISMLSWDADYKPADADEYEKPPISTSKKLPSVHVVFCSKRRPHIFFFHAGEGWQSARIVAIDAPSGAEEYAYALYWASCHHYVGRGRPIEELAGKLGYHLPATEPEDEPDDTIKTPSDLLRELGTGRGR